MTKCRGINRPKWSWTPEQIALLQARYADTRTSELAAQIGCEVTHIYRKVQDLGLRKGECFLATSSSGRILRGGTLSVATQFKKGLVSWNKGKHIPSKGRAVETQFKKGNKPHTWVPIGSLRVNGDGYLDRKVTETPGPTHLRWHPVHRLVWEAANGPTPKGHVVVFKQGRRTTVEAEITLDAIECITRSELLARNSIHNLPPAIAEIARLRGVLNRKINARSPK